MAVSHVAEVDDTNYQDAEIVAGVGSSYGVIIAGSRISRDNL